MGAPPLLLAGDCWVVEQGGDVRGDDTQFQQKGISMLFRRFRKKHGLYNLRKEVARWVEKNIGQEYVDEALEKYDKINSGVPIGGIKETVVFIDMIERIKHNI